MARFLKKFFDTEAAGGLCLIGAAALALLIANTGFGDVWQSFWQLDLGSHSLHDWINDGPMAVFFLLAGLELKREFLHGALRSRRQAALPAIAALGGMIAPCLVYLAAGGPVQGWAIPAATDIAFALGILALIPRVPAGLKIFLTALAVIDDLGAVLIIGIFYAGGLNALALVTAAFFALLLVILNRRNMQCLWPYWLAGLGLWAALLPSGLHPTLAGVALAFALPSGKIERLEHRLHGPVAFGIMPLFALANAGVDLTVLQAGALPAAIALGLWLGKPLGIAGGAWLAVKTRLGALPSQTGWRHILGAAALGGIGFTMSLFIGDLAFADAALQAQARLGVLAGSVLAAVTGAVMLIRSRSLS